MNVNSIFRAVFRKQFAILCGVFVFIVVIFFTASSFVKPSTHDSFTKRVNLSIREIGHRLLLEAGDSTSRILPVKEISEGVFLLEFENEFAFKPDTLMALTQRLLTKTGLKDYTVTVHECFKPEIVYGFQMSTPANSSIKACNGRNQPERCYTIQIAFANFNNENINYASLHWTLTGFLFFISIVFAAKHFGINKSRAGNNRNEEPSVSNVNTVLPTLGKFTFDYHHQKLILGSEVIVLTDKECKILELLN
ncbi:MAG TPA: hypothetical protein VL443_27955, partial [Cyclobacteriaceae bacterium]|nr:hypothetical protein [Cyclobacteriaceae bacterium]